MRYVLWVLKLALFVLVLSFAVKNTDTVTVRYYLGEAWQAPLIIVLLLSFCAGAVVGVLATFTHVLRQRRQIAGLRRALRMQERAGGGPTSNPPGTA